MMKADIMMKYSSIMEEVILLYSIAERSVHSVETLYDDAPPFSPKKYHIQSIHSAIDSSTIGLPTVVVTRERTPISKPRTH